MSSRLPLAPMPSKAERVVAQCANEGTQHFLTLSLGLCNHGAGTNLPLQPINEDEDYLVLSGRGSIEIDGRPRRSESVQLGGAPGGPPDRHGGIGNIGIGGSKLFDQHGMAENPLVRLLKSCAMAAREELQTGRFFGGSSVDRANRGPVEGHGALCLST